MKKYYYKYLNNPYEFLAPKKTKQIIISQSNKVIKGKYDYIILNNLVGETKDVQAYLQKISKNCKPPYAAIY